MDAANRRVYQPRPALRRREIEAMSDDQWFMAIGGHQVGPVSRDDVVTNLRNGTIDGNTLVFGPGLTNWTPLKDVPQLATFLTGSAAGGAAPAPPPPITP